MANTKKEKKQAKQEIVAAKTPTEPLKIRECVQQFLNNLKNYHAKQ